MVWAYVEHAFCPTGEGGGVDPTCSHGESGNEPISAPKLIIKVGGDKHTSSNRLINDVLKMVPEDHLEYVKSITVTDQESNNIGFASKAGHITLYKDWHSLPDKEKRIVLLHEIGHIIDWDDSYGAGSNNIKFSRISEKVSYKDLGKYDWHDHEQELFAQSYALHYLGVKQNRAVTKFWQDRESD